MRLFAFAGAIRRESFNKKLVRLAAAAAERDAEAAAGVPAGAQKLRARFAAADAFLISSPEYNFSVPGTLKNAIDWVSRVNPSAFRDKCGLLCSASPRSSAAIAACGRSACR